MRLLHFALCRGFATDILRAFPDQSRNEALKVSSRFARRSSTGNTMMDCFNHLIVLCNQTIYTSYKSKTRPALRQDLACVREDIFCQG
ncbi:conserved hypothetical protein [Mesorhizobium escarrei]|uniref:Uncharacterized protein n=1 Tax=Mesorhizobium escarrei TaxID=666018 RepID=A0ABM9EIP4_9HYPH|nr:conserved hypothetical protein [Mesorhizobium escarrei]